MQALFEMRQIQKTATQEADGAPVVEVKRDSTKSLILDLSHGDLDYALDLWEEQEKERRYKEDPLGIGGVTTSLWSWGSKAAETAAATAATLSKDVAAKAAEAQCEVAKATAQPKVVVQSLNSYLDSVFPVDDDKAELRAEIDAAEAREATFHELFPPPAVAASEVVIESYSCALMQRYSCGANNATPEIPISFSGTLFVTPVHACFYIDAELHGKSLKVPLLLPLERVIAMSKGKSGSMVRIVLEEPSTTETEGEDDGGGDRSTYIFNEFTDEDALDTALGLLEQMHEESQAGDVTD